MTFVPFLTRDDTEEILDISAEATTRFGFVFQDRVSTPKGPGTVLGVSKSDELYFQLDSDKGCSYWGSCKTKADFEKKGFRVVPQDNMRRHRVKRVCVNGRGCAIVLQDTNGPCPLLAAINALSMRGVEIPCILPNSEVITQETICDAVHTLMLKNVEMASQNSIHRIGNTLTLSGLVEEKREVLKEYFGKAKVESLYQGLDVSPFFTNVDDFEGENDAAFFAALGLKMFHLWVVDEADQPPSLRGKSFNQLQDLAVLEAEDSPQAVAFLEAHAGQVTELGILRLKNALEEGEVGVLFRNNHFSTVLKLKGELRILVTDEGYGDKSLIVFEALSLTGDSSYRDGDGGVIEPVVLSMLEAFGDQYSRREILEARDFLGDAATIKELGEVIESKRQAHVGDGKVAEEPSPQTETQREAVLPNFYQQLLEMGFDPSRCMEVCSQNPASMEVAVALLLS